MSLCWSVTRLISLDCSIQCTVALVEQLGVAVNWLLESMRWQFPARWSVWGRKFSCRARIMCRKWNLLWRKTLMHIARIVVSDTSVWSLKLQLWFDIHWLRSRMSLLSKSLINASGFATANEDWCNHTHEQACVEPRLSTWRYPHLLLSEDACSLQVSSPNSYRSISPARKRRKALSRKPAVCGCCQSEGMKHKDTGKWTDTRLLHRLDPASRTMWAATTIGAL